MIRRIFANIATSLQTPDSAESESPDRDAALRLATATLMVEIARADHVFEESEFERLLELIASHFALSSEDTADLVVIASEATKDIVHLHELTQLLRKHLSDTEKGRVVGLLWQVAYADGQLDKYEDALVSKISALLYVSRGRVMQLKHDAKIEAQKSS